MLWRKAIKKSAYLDDDRLIYQCSFVQDRAHEGSRSIFSCPIGQINNFEYEVWGWLYNAVINSDPTIRTATEAACKTSDHYQSFSLYYIEYLFDEAIDRQIEFETKRSSQYLNKLAEVIKNS